jgi:hypothetical protein
MNGTPFLGAMGGLVPKRYEAAYNQGVRFFVLRYPKQLKFDKLISGFFDVRVTNDGGVGAGVGAVQHITGREAHIKFQVNHQTGAALAYVPDDKYYHNRMAILDTMGRWHLDGIVSRDLGMVTAAEAQMEIKCLDEVIRVDVPMYRVINPENGKEVDWFYTEEEAQMFLEEEHSVIKGKHGVPHFEKPYRKCVIVPGKVREKRPEIKELIRRYAGNPHGWTECDEFQKQWLNQVNEKIRQRREAMDSTPTAATLTEEDVQKQVFNVLASMSPDQIEKMRAIAKSQKDSESKTEEPAPVDTEKHYAKSALERLRIDDIRKIADARGIATFDKTKPSLIEDIMAAQEASQEELT